MENKRLFSRIPFKTEARVLWEGKTFQGQLLDIALKGALLNFPGPLPFRKGDPAELVVELPSSSITMGFSVKFARIEGDNAALYITSADVESVIHLRRLIELNLGEDRKSVV